MRPRRRPTEPSSVCGDRRLRNAAPEGQAFCLSRLHLSAPKYFLLGPSGVTASLPTLRPPPPPSPCCPGRKHPQSRDSEVASGCPLSSSSVDCFPASVTQFPPCPAPELSLRAQLPPPLHTGTFCTKSGPSSHTASTSFKAPNPFLSSDPPVPRLCPDVPPYSLMILCRLLRSSR